MTNENVPQSLFVTNKYDYNVGKYPKIDAHSHAFFLSKALTKVWIELMKKYNITKTHVMSWGAYNKSFDDILDKIKDYKEYFVPWYSIDYSGIRHSDFSQIAVQKLREAKEKGAVGVGEIIDKGNGDLTAVPVSGKGIHVNDPRLFDFFEECGKLKMPVAIHIADPIWMYKESKNNDGFPNSKKYKIDPKKVQCGFEELQRQFEELISKHPNTIFIGCHFVNLMHDLPRLSKLLDTYPNLYVDCAARLGEIDQTLYSTKEFFEKYQDRIIFGFDTLGDDSVWSNNIKILESEEEHFYSSVFGYHWSYTGLGLSESILKKIYIENITRVLNEYV